MEQLIIDKKLAKKLYPKADQELRDLLLGKFGETTFTEKITDRIKTFEDACELLGFSPAFSDLDGPDEIAYKKLKIIIRALNEGWVPDWNNSNQRKWAPWFEYSSSGFRFHAAAYALTYTDSTGGSRLCFASEELAIYAAKQFVDLYNQFLK